MMTYMSLSVLLEELLRVVRWFCERLEICIALVAEFSRVCLKLYIVLRNWGFQLVELEVDL